MTRTRCLLRLAILAAVPILVSALLDVDIRAQTTAASALAGAWTRNGELSDPPPSFEGHRREGGERGRGGMGHGGYGGGMGRGGFGGGMGHGGGRMNADPEKMARMREALHDILVPPDHLTIAQTESMIVLTGPDGRTTRLSPDGKKIADDNTKIERKTRWDGDKLVSEITGAGSGKITQTFAVDPETHQLRLVVQLDGGQGNQPRSFTNVYDADAR